jgi:hypothetical protein
MRQLLTWGFALCSAVLPMAQAKADPVVVELFTSQGCSSCPAADELLRQLAARDDVIALALHIDYWDYIGWKDDFANPAFTRRQKAYAHAQGNKMIYTPQMIVDGADDVVGNRAMDVAELVAHHLADKVEPVDLEIERDSSVLSIEVEAETQLGEADVFVVRYAPEETVDVLRGENAGKRLTYTHIVTDWQKVARWDGANALDVEVPIEGDQPIVVLVQADKNGPILAAARIN